MIALDAYCAPVQLTVTRLDPLKKDGHGNLCIENHLDSLFSWAELIAFIAPISNTLSRRESKITYFWNKIML
jgi:hypothetical protein